MTTPVRHHAGGCTSRNLPTLRLLPRDLLLLLYDRLPDSWLPRHRQGSTLLILTVLNTGQSIKLGRVRRLGMSPRPHASKTATHTQRQTHQPNTPPRKPTHLPPP